jgi:hypothetical protein
MERARSLEKTKASERARYAEKTSQKERVKTKTERNNQMKNEQDRAVVRMLVRARCDFQDMRKSMDNRLGRKADGKEQDVERLSERVVDVKDADMFNGIAGAAKTQEQEIEKQLKKVLKRFPIYTEWLSKVKGVGTIGAGWMIAEYDIERATTVSKLWQFTGLNPGMVCGTKRKEVDGVDTFIRTNELIRGDRLTPGFVAPFNKRLRVAMVGVLADGFIKAQNDYCMNYYYPYKKRLENEARQAEGMNSKGKPFKAWSEESKGHRDRAAKRYMIKMFLKDLYVQWRTIEGLEVREPYSAEYLGKRHAV